MSRVAIVGSAVALVLAACGDEGTDGAGSDELQPPVPIEFSAAGIAGAASADRVAADAEMATDPASSFLPMFAGYEFSVADGFPDLPTASTGYRFPTGAEVDPTEVQRIATALGVEGEVEQGGGATVDGVLWRVGPDDGSAPSLTVGADGMLGWYYSAPWSTDAVRAAETCVSVAVPDEPAADPDAPTSASAPDANAPVDDAEPEVAVREECAVETPEPPEGILTTDEAEARTTDLLEALGEDPSQFRFDTYADEWFASVSAAKIVDGLSFPTTWSFGFGENGTLQYANGILADPVATGPYPLIGLDEALERLEDQSGVWGGGGIATADVARSADPTGAQGAAEAGVGVAEPPATEPAVDESSTSVPDTTIVPDTTVPGEAPAPTTGPVDTKPVETVVVDTEPVETVVPEPEPLPAEPEQVVLTDVKADLWWVWDADGTVWLLPAYTFSDAEGRTFTVAAVTEEFLIVVEPEILPEPEPLPDIDSQPPATDGGGVDGTGVDGTGVDGQVDPSVVDAFVGLPLDEFTKAAEELGLTVRVAREDGEDLALTMDYSPSRLNVAVEDGVVTEVLSVG